MPGEGAAEGPVAVPRERDGGVFRAPWEAQAFALTVTLHEKGLFTWSEWSEALGREIAADPDGSGERYYQHWLAALERLLALKGVVGEAERLRRCDAWDRAARATPHGRPIVLSPDSRHERDGS